MLLTKLKSVGWGLLLAASLAAGAVAFTYRPAAAQNLGPAPKAPAAEPPVRPAEAPPARAGAADRDELEALRLELEALRLEVRADRERIKALEDKAQAAPGRPAVDNKNRGKTAPDAEYVRPGGFDDKAPADKGRYDRPDYKSDRAINIDDEKATGAGDKEDPAAYLEDLVKRLRQHPDDKQALDELERAVHLLKERAPHNQDRNP